MTTKQAKVIPMQQQDDPAVVAVRAFASARALYVVTGKLRDDLKRVTKKFADQLDEATREYRTILRDEREGVERLNQKSAKDLFIQVVKGLEKRDDIDAKSKAAKTERKERIKKFEAAFIEVIGIGKRIDGDQIDMYSATGAAPGMGWATKDTCDAVYSALLALDKEHALDDDQRSLLADLSGAGLEAIELGLVAEEAIEADVATTEDREDDEDASGESQINIDEVFVN